MSVKVICLLYKELYPEIRQVTISFNEVLFSASFKTILENFDAKHQIRR